MVTLRCVPFHLSVNRECFPLASPFFVCEWPPSIGLVTRSEYAYAQKAAFLTDLLPAWQLAGGGKSLGIANLPGGRLSSGAASVTISEEGYYGLDAMAHMVS